MKCKRILSFLVALIVAGILSGGSVTAAEHSESNLDWKLGVGYQGMWVGGFLNGLSARAWIEDRFGVEGNFFYGGVDYRVRGGNNNGIDGKLDAELYIFELKLMYSPIVRDYSRFYGGIKGSIGYVDLDIYDTDYSDNIYGLGLFVGSEWHFQEFPELGFNFDVGYDYYTYDDRIDGVRVDLDLKGIGATFGIHYYF